MLHVHILQKRIDTNHSVSRIPTYWVCVCVAVGCSVLQWVAVCCSVLQCVAKNCRKSLGDENTDIIHTSDNNTDKVQSIKYIYCKKIL